MIVPTFLAGWPATPSHSPRFTTLSYILLNCGLNDGNHG